MKHEDRCVARTATLGDVAQAAKLSPAATSRHLNGLLRLPPETVRRIEAAVRALEYRPNATVRGLSLGRSHTVGLVLPEIANPFFSQIAAALEAADARGLGVMLCSSLNKPQREIDYIARLRRNLVNGPLLATNHTDDGPLAAAVNAAPSMVLLDENVEGANVPNVYLDNAQGGALAAAHLLGFCHARLAYIGGPPGLVSTRERHAGFARVIRKTGPGRVLAVELTSKYSREHGERAAERLMTEHPGVTAVFAGSDEILIGLIAVLRRRGLRVGEDVSVVTFADAGPLDLLDRPVTAIRQPVEEIGRRALDCVLALPAAAESRIERLPVQLVQRASVTAPPARQRGARAGTQRVA